MQLSHADTSFSSDSPLHPSPVLFPASQCFDSRIGKPALLPTPFSSTTPMVMDVSRMRAGFHIIWCLLGVIEENKAVYE